MYCILVTGIPASGKSTLAAAIAGALRLPWISKDRIKELLFDRLGFRSREEKVRLGLAAMDAMYYCAEQLMAAGKPFILENNFENSSREPLLRLLERHGYQAITLTLTGDYRRIYERFLLRNAGPERHRGHVVNTCYPELPGQPVEPPLTYEQFVDGIRARGMDSFTANGPRIVADTTDFAALDVPGLVQRLTRCAEEILQAQRSPKK